jgi:transcriptional regulator with XRE-family HTH domain
MTFGRTLRRLRLKTGKSRYRLAQYSGIDQAYLQRLETEERRNPSRDVVLALALALVEGSHLVSVDQVDELLLAAGYAPLRHRGDTRIAA